MRMDPAVAAVRSGVRAALTGLDAGDLVLAGVSGGPDSLALAAALAAEAPRAGLRAGAVTVDHGLQPGSAHRAAAVATCATGLGLQPVVTETVVVASDGRGGPEAAARSARYAALERACERHGAVRILLGHTLDDQAETVLLGLGRGSGARSLAGMAPVRGRYHRPLLGVRRAQTLAACDALGLPVWHDPHNADPAFARVRVRTRLLPALERELGPGVAEALARSAALLRDDADALDRWAATVTDPGDAVGLAALPGAVRSRVLRTAAIAAGAPAGALSAEHVRAIDRLVTDWHGQGPLNLPGGLVATRSCDRLTLR
jgi:tRNA(Ile)-lysidine synthase